MLGSANNVSVILVLDCEDGQLFSQGEPDHTSLVWCVEWCTHGFKQPGPKVSALVTLDGLTKHPPHQSVHYGLCLQVRQSVCLWLLCKVVHVCEDIPFPSVCAGEWPHNIHTHHLHKRPHWNLLDVTDMLGGPLHVVQLSQQLQKSPISQIKALVEMGVQSPQPHGLTEAPPPTELWALSPATLPLLKLASPMKTSGP